MALGSGLELRVSGGGGFGHELFEGRTRAKSLFQGLGCPFGSFRK